MPGGKLPRAPPTPAVTYLPKPLSPATFALASGTPLSECYTGTGSAFYVLSGHNINGQTFRPTHDHFLDFIDITLKVGPTTAKVIVRVFHADVWHKPTGDTLAWRHLTMPLALPGAVRRIRFPMFMRPMLYKDLYYIICISHNGILLGTPAQVHYDHFDSHYLRGHRTHSEDGGETWTLETDQDTEFCEFGDPPLQKPLPEPPIENFTALKLEYHPTLTGYIIHVTTNVPCHLFFVYTLQEPDKHKESILVRGLPTKDALRYCFVGFEYNEQHEEGDTLFHTFTKEPWPFCQTRYFTFRAKIDDQWSASVGPIFKKHMDENPYNLVLLEPWTNL